MAWFVRLVLFTLQCWLVSSSNQTDALAAITQGVCNVSSDAEMCADATCLALIVCDPIRHRVIAFDMSTPAYATYPTAPALLFSSQFALLTDLMELVLLGSNIVGTIPTELGMSADLTLSHAQDYCLLSSI
jgi:hypothetical protein